MVCRWVALAVASTLACSTSEGTSEPVDCDSIVSRTDCAAAGQGECTWREIYAVTQGTDGTCSFVESGGVCLTNNNDLTGCTGTPVADCDGSIDPYSIYVRTADGNTEIVRWPLGDCLHFGPDGWTVCLDNGASDPASLQPPICTCGCDPAYPG